MLVENKVPSLLLLVFRQQLKQEKQLLKRLSHRLWKAISMRVGIGLGDTYGPMHYPGMRSLWQSPANFHQHLAFPSLPPSSCPPTWFLFLLLHLLLLSQKNKKNPCVPVIVPGWGPLIEQQKEEKKSVLFAEYATKLKACNHTALFPIMMELIVDTSGGENLFDSALIE